MAVSSALATLIIILIIGIAAGLAFNRYAGTWLSRQFTTRQSDINSALVGIAGAFIGYHLGIVFGLPSPLVLYVAAIIGALVVLWAWRGR